MDMPVIVGDLSPLCQPGRSAVDDA